MAEPIDLDRVLAEVHQDRELRVHKDESQLASWQFSKSVVASFDQRCAAIESLAAELRAARQRIEKFDIAKDNIDELMERWDQSSFKMQREICLRFSTLYMDALDRIAELEAALAAKERK